MSKLPQISGHTCVVTPQNRVEGRQSASHSTIPCDATICLSALNKVGSYVRRQRGSHVVLRRDDPYAQLVVPDHNVLDRGTLRAIIRQAGLSVEEFVDLL